MGLLQKRSTGTFLSFTQYCFFLFSFAYLVVGTFYKLSKMYRANYYCCSVAVCIFCFCFFFIFIFFGNLQVASRAKIINMTFVVHLLSLSFFFSLLELKFMALSGFSLFFTVQNRRKFQRQQQRQRQEQQQRRQRQQQFLGGTTAWGNNKRNGTARPLGSSFVVVVVIVVVIVVVAVHCVLVVAVRCRCPLSLSVLFVVRLLAAGVVSSPLFLVAVLLSRSCCRCCYLSHVAGSCCCLARCCSLEISLDRLLLCSLLYLYSKIIQHLMLLLLLVFAFCIFA